MDTMVLDRDTTINSTDATSFGQLLQHLTLGSSEKSDSASREEALQDMCDFFSYECAFIYELNSSQTLSLQEHVGSFGHNPIPQTLALDSLLHPNLTAYLTFDQLSIFNFPNSKDITSPLIEHLAIKGLAITLLTDDEGGLIGCTGMADTREHPQPNAEIAAWIHTAFIPVIEKVRFRIYRQRLSYTSDTLESIMDHIGFDIYVNDFETHEMLYANRSMAEPYGGWEAMRGKKCFHAIYDDKDDECEYCPKPHLLDDKGNPSKVYSWDYQRPFDGCWFRVISAAFQWTDGRLAHVISSTDINDAKNNELLIKRMAFFDLLTGIPNRRKLEIDLEKSLDQAIDQGEEVAVLFLDLDNFKAVNDHYGHNGGDVLLKHVSQLFLDDPLTANRCYRYGGDEFIFVFEGVDFTQAQNYGKQIIEILETPFKLEGDWLSCSGSFGIACYPKDGEDYWGLLDKADDAMYASKQRNRVPTRSN